MDHPTLLLIPRREDKVISRAEVIVPGQPDEYKVRQEGEWWTVTRLAEVIYQGPGPVEVKRSRAPF